jgi:GAF domain/ANTAR domain
MRLGALMADDLDRAARVQRLIELEASGAAPRLAGRLHRLCAALLRALPASGVAVTLIVDHRPDTVVAASDGTSERLAELQLTLGEGPCQDAAAARRPILEPDLTGPRTGQWPAFGSAAQELGVRAVFAFPMQVGEAQLGVLEAYRENPGSLTRDQFLEALAFARAALEMVLDGYDRDQASHGSAVDAALTRNTALYQAQGMVMVQLGVTLVEALSLIRAHAFAHDLRLGDVARDIVAGKLTLDGDSSRIEE